MANPDIIPIKTILPQYEMISQATHFIHVTTFFYQTIGLIGKMTGFMWKFTGLISHLAKLSYQ